MTRRDPKITERGMALILVLVLLGVTSAAFATYFLAPSLAERFGGIFRRGKSLQLEAESGFEIAKRELLDRANNNDFTTAASAGTPLSLSQATDVGLVPPADGGSRNLIPRLTTLSGSIQRDIYYFPDKGNGRVDLAQWPRPKYFHIISQTTNTRTGEIYTMEGLIQLRLENFAEFSFGLLHPKVPPNVTEIKFHPATYGGHVHFGLFDDPTIPIRFASSGEPPLHEFNGPVTFEANPPEGNLPFNYSATSTDVVFREGYKTDYPLSAESAPIFDSITSRNPQTFPGGSSDHVCLKFMPNTGSAGAGEVWQYACNNADPDPFNRYVGESTGGGVIAKFPASGIFFSEANLHVKGTVHGSLSVVSNAKIYIEGDVVYFDQHPTTSADLAGFIAKDDLFIPTGVPFGISRDKWRVEQGDPGDPGDQFMTGVTNFVVDNDRNEDPDSEYTYHWNNPPNWPLDETHPAIPGQRYPGWKKSSNVLDLDGMYMSVEGGLFVDGINNYDVNPTDGTVIPAVDGNYYTREKGKPNSYLYTIPDPADPTKVKWTRRADPLYCASGDWYGMTMIDMKCMLGMELPRPQAPLLWIFGGLVVNDYTYSKSLWWVCGYKNGLNAITDSDLGEPPWLMKVPWDEGVIAYNSGGNCTQSGGVEPGFRRRVILHDERFNQMPPPGFPNTNTPVMHVEWTKRSRGGSERLTLAN